MDLDELDRLASQQLADFDLRTPNRLFSSHPGLTIAEAYELQHKVVQLRERRGERIIGYKIGCTSKAIQRQLDIHEPIFGRLFDTGSRASGARLSRSQYANLAIEGELAIRLAKDLSDPPYANEEWLNAIETIFPVIELHDYVLRSPQPCCQELIASNGMNAGVVLAEQACAGPLVATRRLCIRINDDEVESTEAPWTMDRPIASLRWLADRLKHCGLCLRRGQVILTGSPMRLYPITASCRVSVEAHPQGGSHVVID